MTQRLAYRITEVMELAGVSRDVVQAAINRGEIRARKRGRIVLLDPIDIETAFGFHQDDRAPIRPSAESSDEIRKLLA